MTAPHRRWITSGSIAVALLAAAGPALAAQAPAGASPTCVTAESMSEPGCVVVPVVGPADGLPVPSPVVAAATTSPGAADAHVAGTTSLPFTGADIEELAVVGGGAVLAGGLLIRRRRRSLS
jgi:LPXTG-motif cell wall-anchored protein